MKILNELCYKPKINLMLLTNAEQLKTCFLEKTQQLKVNIHYIVYTYLKVKIYIIKKLQYLLIKALYFVLQSIKLKIYKNKQFKKGKTNKSYTF